MIAQAASNAQIDPAMVSPQPVISILGINDRIVSTVAVLLHAGFSVICADSDTDKVETLTQRIALGIDTALMATLRLGQAEGNLLVTDDIFAAVAESDITFIRQGPGEDFRGEETNHALTAMGRTIGAAIALKPGFHIVVQQAATVPGITRRVLIPAIGRVGPAIGHGLRPLPFLGGLDRRGNARRRRSGRGPAGGHGPAVGPLPGHPCGTDRQAEPDRLDRAVRDGKPDPARPRRNRRAARPRRRQHPAPRWHCRHRCGTAGPRLVRGSQTGMGRAVRRQAAVDARPRRGVLISQGGAGIPMGMQSCDRHGSISQTG